MNTPSARNGSFTSPPDMARPRLERSCVREVMADSALMLARRSIGFAPDGVTAMTPAGSANSGRRRPSKCRRTRAPPTVAVRSRSMSTSSGAVAARSRATTSSTSRIASSVPVSRPGRVGIDQLDADGRVEVGGPAGAGVGEAELDRFVDRGVEGGRQRQRRQGRDGERVGRRADAGIELEPDRRRRHRDGDVERGAGDPDVVGRDGERHGHRAVGGEVEAQGRDAAGDGCLDVAEVVAADVEGVDRRREGVGVGDTAERGERTERLVQAEQQRGVVPSRARSRSGRRATDSREVGTGCLELLDEARRQRLGRRGWRRRRQPTTTGNTRSVRHEQSYPTLRHQNPQSLTVLLLEAIVSPRAHAPRVPGPLVHPRCKIV